MKKTKHRIYQPGDWQQGSELPLDAQAASHLARVLRLKSGDNVTLFNGQGLEAEAELITVDKRHVSVRIIDAQTISKESPLTIHLAQAISKGDRMDFVVQKAVELGVASITPLISARCVVKLDEKRLAKKLSAWQGIIESACEQCGRNQLPILHPVSHFKAFLTSPLAEQALFLHPTNSKKISELASDLSWVSVLIGPEGGFSDEEVMLAREKAAAISLGPRVLRTETAALAAITAAQLRWGDL